MRVVILCPPRLLFEGYRSAAWPPILVAHVGHDELERIPLHDMDGQHQQHEYWADSAIPHSRAMVLVTPDVGFEGVAVSLLNSFTEKALTVEGLVPISVTSRMFIQLYAKNLSSGGSERFDGMWIGPELHAIGNSFLLFVRAVDSGADLTNRLLEWKGSSRIDELSTGWSLRNSSKHVTKCASLIHTSDSFEESLREFSLLVGGSEILECVRQAVAGQVISTQDLLAVMSVPTPSSRLTAADFLQQIFQRARKLLQLDALWQYSHTAISKDERVRWDPLQAMRFHLHCSVRNELQILLDCIAEDRRPDPDLAELAIEILEKNRLLQGPGSRIMAKVALAYG